MELESNKSILLKDYENIKIQLKQLSKLVEELIKTRKEIENNELIDKYNETYHEFVKKERIITQLQEINNQLKLQNESLSKEINELTIKIKELKEIK